LAENASANGIREMLPQSWMGGCDLLDGAADIRAGITTKFTGRRRTTLEFRTDIDCRSGATTG
jgi:hypothetical protein